MYVRECFRDLRDERQYGAMDGMSEIPFSAIHRWAETYGLSLEQFDELKRAIRALDQVWIEWNAEQQKQAAKEDGDGRKAEPTPKRSHA